MTVAIPTKTQWQTQTSSVIRTRGGHNPELLDIDQLLDLYQVGGDWTSGVDPLIKIRKKIGAWEQRRLNDQSARRPAIVHLRGLVEDRLRELVSPVFQCETRILHRNDEPRFLITCGVLSCIVVMLYDPVSKASCMAHLQEANEADQSIAIMVQQWQDQMHGITDGLVATFVGGRTMNAKKMEALEKALRTSKFNPAAFKRHDVLRDKNSLAIHAALDRLTGDSFTFPDEIKDVDWKLRTERARTRIGGVANRKDPVLQTYDRNL